MVAFVMQDARASAPPADEAAFTEHVAAMVRKALPNHEIDIAGRLELRIRQGADGGWSVFLERIHVYCQANVSDCERVVGSFVARAAATTNETIILDHAMFRVVVRPREYVDFALDALAKQIAGDLGEVCVVDAPTSVQVLGKRNLAELQLTEDEVFGIARNNTAAGLQPLENAIGNGRALGANTLRGDFYESSRFAVHALWKPLAIEYAGELLVAVPGVDTIVFADGRQPGAIADLRARAALIASAAERQVSVTVFRWTPDGWEVVPN